MRAAAMALIVVLGAPACGLAVSPDRDAGIDAAREMDARPPPAPDVGTPTPDGGHDAGHDAAFVGCGATCMVHDDCTRMCGIVAGGGIRCCDDATAHCYVSHTAVCPGESRDGGYDTLPEPLDGCPMPPLGTTELTVHAPGFPNATVSFVTYYTGQGGSLVLDDAGNGTANVLMLGISREGALPALVDAWGVPVVFHVMRGPTEVVDIVPHAFAPSAQGIQPVDTVELLLRRDVPTDRCTGVVSQVSYGCTAYHGDYSPLSLDDAACGPF